MEDVLCVPQGLHAVFHRGQGWGGVSVVSGWSRVGGWVG